MCNVIRVVCSVRNQGTTRSGMVSYERHDCSTKPPSKLTAKVAPHPIIPSKPCPQKRQWSFKKEFQSHKCAGGDAVPPTFWNIGFLAVKRLPVQSVLGVIHTPLPLLEGGTTSQTPPSTPSTTLYTNMRILLCYSNYGFRLVIIVLPRACSP